MLNERFAYVESVKLMNVLNKDNCLFTQIPYEFKIYRVAIGFSKTFPYASLFNNAISQAKEAGSLQRILKKWAIKTRTDCNSGTGFESMGWENVISAFVMIGGGLLLSLLVCCIEICCSRISNMQLK